MAGHNDFGVMGEQIAKKFLVRQGYEILEENWRYLNAEIDLIAWKDDRIIFTEVKTRHLSEFGEPEDFITEGKVRQVAMGAEQYIELMDHHGQVRFDVIAILFQNSKDYTLKHIDDAFWPE